MRSYPQVARSLHWNLARERQRTRRRVLRLAAVTLAVALLVLGAFFFLSGQAAPLTRLSVSSLCFTHFTTTTTTTKREIARII